MFDNLGEYADAHVTTSSHFESEFQNQIQKRVDEFKKSSKAIDGTVLIGIERN